MLYSRRDLSRIVIPLVGEQILAVTVGIADTVMVAYSGEAAVSGVAIVDSITMLLLQIFAALCTGGAVVVSQYLGNKNTANAAKTAAQLIQVVGGVSLLLSLLALMLRVPLLSGIFGAVDKPVMDAALIYFTITAFSFPFLGLYNAGAALLRSINATGTSLNISILINVLNVSGNALLIYGLKLGVAGAAYASLFARAVGAVVIMIILYHRQNPFTIRGLLFRLPDFKTLSAILHIGVPSGFENGMFQIGKLLVQRLVTSFGTVAIAANAAAGNIACLATIPGGAVSLALLTVMGRCMGAKLPEEGAIHTKRLMKLAFLSMAILNVLIFIFIKPIVSIYNLSPETQAQTIQLVMFHCVFAGLLWTPSFCLPSALRGAGDVSFTMKVSVASMWAMRIAGSYILAQGLGLGIFGIWLAIFLDWLIRAAFFYIRFKRGKWRSKQVIK